MNFIFRMMGSSETSITTYKITQHHNAEDNNPLDNTFHGSHGNIFHGDVAKPWVFK
jgi:hypothetical protein